ncbi:metal-dependent hydrolase family protein [Acetilactobacillus jinshanensis]|uniref:Amidohydrolase family protein n=1 Tax=Acetilactobacillus jinshanensis TaxID=1720083 RepID=A0A4P6ZL44_9LACO|nr:amidohydrolase family protein [Acetilactobacillus jinshanensis]QBP18142.1 amidohydrolase family protein [Acetilactobacillus jinshanensis]URL61008.1 amidohydrolase family protein [uncultured bacterium]
MTETLYQNLNLFNGKDDGIKDHCWFLVDDQSGKIEKLGNGAAPKADHIVDLHGKYVMPGLINVHTHITFNQFTPTGDTDISQTRAVVRAIKNLRTLLKSGVTYIRSCGDIYNIDIVLSKLINAGELTKVPRIVPAGRPYSMTGGHGDMPNWGYLVDSCDEMRKAVRRGIKRGAKSIKVMATGGVMTEQDFMDDPQLSAAEMHTAVVEAHHKHLIVSAHAEGNPGIMNAIKAGVDSIEHGFYVNDQEIKLMLKHHIYLTPTLGGAWKINTYGDKTLPKWEMNKMHNAFSDLVKNLSNAWHQGVKFTLGTDAGCPYCFFWDTPLEFEIIAKKLHTSNFASLLMNLHSAQLTKLDDHYGTLEPGKYADFLVLDHDPLKDLKAVQQKDKQVYQHGKRQF